MNLRTSVLFSCGLGLAGLLTFLGVRAIHSRLPFSPSNGSGLGPTEQVGSGNTLSSSIKASARSSSQESLPASEPATLPDTGIDRHADSDSNELSPSVVVEIWKKNANSAGIASLDVERVSSWLQHVLSHRHRRIDTKAVGDFARAVKEFPANVGIAFDGKENPDATELMEFCDSVVWGEEPAGNSGTDGVMQQLRTINATTLGEVEKAIEASLPAESKPKWQPEIEQDIRVLSAKIEQSEKQLANDFLFPAFKHPLTDIQQKVAEEWLRRPNIVPKYGGTDQIMQTPDEAFAIRLQRFAQVFDAYYLFAFSAQQVIFEHEKSHDWYKYNMELAPAAGTWAAVPHLDLPKSSPTTAPEISR